MTPPTAAPPSSSTTAAASGQFAIGGDITVNRLGFGAMRVTGKGIWGEPTDREAAAATLRRLPELGVNLIDTADCYGPFVSEDMLRQTLHPYSGLTIATKGGIARSGPGRWEPLGRPEYLRQCVLMSLRRLNVERIDLWQLHWVDPRVDREEQFGAVAEMHKAGLIRHVGLSNVTVDDIQAAGQSFPVATVQNCYNVTDRRHEDVLDHCQRENIGFIAYAPLGGGKLAQPNQSLATIAKRLNATPGQIALAWILKRSPVTLPIPGTANPDHLVQNVAAAVIELSDEDFKALSQHSDG